MSVWKVKLVLLVFTGIVLVTAYSGPCIIESVYDEYCIVCTSYINIDYISNYVQDYSVNHFKFRGFTDYDSVTEITTETNSEFFQPLMINLLINMFTWHHSKTFEVSYNEFDTLYVNYFSNLYVTNLTIIRNTIATLKNLNNISMKTSTQSRVESLDLSYNLIEIIPKNIFLDFNNLITLNLSHNVIHTTDVLSFQGLKKLSRLHLEHNHLQSFGNMFSKVSNLETLLMNHNDLSYIDADNFKGLTELKFLNISFNILQHIHYKAFHDLESLLELDLQNNLITQISKDLFEKNTHLFSLMLHGNNINNIHSQAFKHNKICNFEIKNNKLGGILRNYNISGLHVYDLDLSNEQITTIGPGAFTSVRASLQFLNISSNLIDSIYTNAFESLEKLKVLDISNNYLSKVNFQMNDLKQLAALNISKNRLNKIFTKTFDNITLLNLLDLSLNFITEIEPYAFDSLKNLEKLLINNNEIKELHKGTFEGLPVVRFIDMSYLKYKVLKNESFCDFKFLKIINSSHGVLEDIEYNAFKNMEKLAYLDFSFNFLSNFKVNTRSIKGAVRIYLCHNRIAYIENEMFQSLIHLRILDLSNNNILTIKVNAFQSLIRLTSLDMSFNPHANYNNGSNLYEISTNSFSVTDILDKFSTSLNLSNCNLRDMALFNTPLLNVDVKELFLSSNEISIINKESFQKTFMKTVETIDLSSNIIKYVQPGSFLNLRNLKEMNLRRNFISNLEQGMFNGLSKLEKLDISFNLITTFDDYILPNAPKTPVKVLILDNNKIKSINLRSFYKPKNKEIKIFIGGNLIRCEALNSIYDNEIQLYSLTPDYYTQNVNGITCVKTDTGFTFK